MAGSLVQVASTTVSSGTASVTLTGINSDDVYMLSFNNVQVADDGSHTYQYFYGRLTESGSANSTSNYDYAAKQVDAHNAFSNVTAQNQDKFQPVFFRIADDSTGFANGIMYIYNANDSSEYTFLTIESAATDGGGEFASGQGGVGFTVTSAVDGIQFYFANSKNITAGTFTLYKVV